MDREGVSLCDIWTCLHEPVTVKLGNVPLILGAIIVLHSAAPPFMLSQSRQPSGTELNCYKLHHECDAYLLCRLCAGSLGDGRWTTWPWKGEISWNLRYLSHPSSSGTSESWAAGPPPRWSLTTWSGSMGLTSCCQPLWEVNKELCFLYIFIKRNNFVIPSFAFGLFPIYNFSTQMLTKEDFVFLF